MENIHAVIYDDLKPVVDFKVDKTDEKNFPEHDFVGKASSFVASTSPSFRVQIGSTDSQPYTLELTKHELQGYKGKMSATINGEKVRLFAYIHSHGKGGYSATATVSKSKLNLTPHVPKQWKLPLTENVGKVV